MIVADGEFDTSTATGELVLNMMLSLAQFELRRIKENWSTAKSACSRERNPHHAARSAGLRPRGRSSACPPLEARQDD